MLRRMFTATLVATVFTLVVPSPRVTAYSDWIGAFAVIDKVVLEPGSGAPDAYTDLGRLCVRESRGSQLL